MVTVKDIEQELIDVNSQIKHYSEKEPSEKKLVYWKTIQKYVKRKLAYKISLEYGRNS